MPQKISGVFFKVWLRKLVVIPELQNVLQQMWDDLPQYFAKKV